MQKNTFILLMIIFFLCKASHLFANFDDVQNKYEFKSISFEQFVQSLEDKFQVKIDVCGIDNNQNFVMNGGYYTLHDAFVHFFKINNIKNSSFILDEKEKMVKVWILSDNEGTKSNSVAGNAAKNGDGQVEGGNPEIGSELDASSVPRTEFTEEEIKQMEEERIVYENSPNNPRAEFTEEVIRQMEDERIVYKN